VSRPHALVARDDPRRLTLQARCTALVEAARSSTALEAARDVLLADLCAFQSEHTAPYVRLVAAARRPSSAHLPSPTRWPALPTDVFRMARVSTYDAAEDVRVFRTSGTTSGARGAHAFRDLALYDHAARTAADAALFPDLVGANARARTMRLVMLAPHERDAPDSSLSYMLTRFAEWYGDPREDGVTWALRDGVVEVDALTEALARATSSDEPVALLGTSFAFVFADDALGAQRFSLPPGSRVMQTGGFKGRTRTLEPDAMRALLSARYGMPDAFVIAEYGMTELSSQLYEGTLADALRGRSVAPRALRVPPWMCATPVDPETLAPVPHGEVGVLRLDDPANLDSVCAVQTSDLARRVDGGIVLLGRAPGAVPRGCSLAIEEAMTGHADV
jgi:hypothetical protein